MKKIGRPQADINEDVDQSSLQVPTYTKISLSERDVAEIFMEHGFSSRAVIAERWGIERLFQEDPKKPTNIVQRLYADVMKNRDRYKEYIDDGTVEDIQSAVQTRLINHEAYGDVAMQYKSVKHVMARPIMDMARKLETVHEKSVNLLDLKLAGIKTKNDVKKEDILKIANVVKITGEQKRLANGEATQHVAHVIKQSGIDEMSTSQLVDILNQQREDEMSQ